MVTEVHSFKEHSESVVPKSIYREVSETQLRRKMVY